MVPSGPPEIREPEPKAADKSMKRTCVSCEREPASDWCRNCQDGDWEANHPAMVSLRAKVDRQRDELSTMNAEWWLMMNERNRLRDVAKLLHDELIQATTVLRDMTVGAPVSRAEEAAVHAELILLRVERPMLVVVSGGAPPRGRSRQIPEETNQRIAAFNALPDDKKREALEHALRTSSASGEGSK